MKQYFLTTILLCSLLAGFAQPGKKPVKKETPPSQAEMNKAMEDAMKGMSEEEKAEMRKMMGSIMPALTDQNNKTANYPEFTSNAELIPAKNLAKINAVRGKKLTQAEVTSYATNLYNKIMTKGDADEIAIIKKVIAKSPKANDLGKAAITCAMQGYPQAAMALSMKAVAADPTNANWQNNMASLLTQYGYPEQALPVLQKLNGQIPNNSTVLNNLAYAWLGLGATDSAKVFAGMAAKANPRHADAKLINGLMNETNGDASKSIAEYEHSIEAAVNPFAENVIKNNNNSDQINNRVNFERIKKSLPIYEYFPRNWIPTRMLKPSVLDYQFNDSLQRSYTIMDEKMDKDIELLSEAASREVNAQYEQGEEQFVKQMATEMIGGITFMSKPAARIIIILHQYGAELMNRTQQEALKLQKSVEELRKIRDKKIKGSPKCNVYEAADNEFMDSANKLIYSFYITKAEEYRVYLNALVTWNWYVVGNPKNIIVMQDINATAWLQSLYISAMTQQIASAPTCKYQKAIDPVGIPAPPIPNFTCPAIVSIPVGEDWQELVKATKNFDKNTAGITQNGAHPMPNISVAYGIGTMIAQPGKAASIKTANGSVTPSITNVPDNQLTPLQTIDDLTPLPDLRRMAIANALLKDMMNGDCKNVKKYKYPKLIFGIGQLEFAPEMEFGIGPVMMTQDMGMAEKETKIIGNVTQVEYENGTVIIFSQEGEIIRIDTDNTRGGHKVATFTQKSSTPGNAVSNDISSALKQYSESGLQPSISSGMQVPGMFKGIAGLFQ